MMQVAARSCAFSRASCSGWTARQGLALPHRAAGHVRIGARRARRGLAVSALLDPSVATSVLHEAGNHVHLANHIAALAEDVPAAAAASGAGPFDFLAIAFENVLEFLDGLLEKANVPYSYGFSIILLTILVKVATFPLTQKQVQSTVAIQALQPRVKELQAKYANDTETLQLETARLYRDAGVNPLAGCLPTLATIPVFIGLYRALTLAAQDNLLDQDFLWIPSLGGPSSSAQQAAGQGLSWLFPFVDGHPPIGWSAAIAYLVLPVLLVVSQYVSQRIISPPSNDPAQAQSQAILRFLPLMIGWFSLNVPAGLTLYWFVNNLLSTGQQVYLKSVTKITVPEPAGPPPGVIQSGTTPYISPKEEKVKRVTGKELGARKKRRDDDVIDVEIEEIPEASASPANGSASTSPKKAVSGGKGDKFRARKAREAASKAATIAAPPPKVGSGAGAGASNSSESSSPGSN